VGEAVTNFSRIHVAGTLRGANGEALQELANVSPFIWKTKWKILGMDVGGWWPFRSMISTTVLPVRAPTGPVSDYVFGLCDVAIIPFGLHGESKPFDDKFGAGPWRSTGRFQPAFGNHILGQLCLYPHGSRRSWSVSAMARFEQNFTQRSTDIEVEYDLASTMALTTCLRIGINQALKRQPLPRLRNWTRYPIHMETELYLPVAVGLRRVKYIPGKNASAGNRLWFRD